MKSRNRRGAGGREGIGEEQREEVGIFKKTEERE
jgi:hypothetical protein